MLCYIVLLFLDPMLISLDTGVIVGTEKVQYGVEEGAGSATVCVSLLGEPGGDVVVTLETADREARGEERRGRR